MKSVKILSGHTGEIPQYESAILQALATKDFSWPRGRAESRSVPLVMQKRMIYPGSS